jgi:hypothetical protein
MIAQPIRSERAGMISEISETVGARQQRLFVQLTNCKPPAWECGLRRRIGARTGRPRAVGSMYSIITLMATILLACALWCLVCRAFQFRPVAYAVGAVILSVWLILALG